jgi:predicted DNA-binding protein (MmcQ/YjbR family)
VAKRPRELSALAIAAVARLKAASSSLAGVMETVTFGNPTFKVNDQSFAVVDRYNNLDCLWLRVEASDRASLLKRRGWFPSPYDPKHVALCCELEQFDWRRLSPLLRKSYDLVLSPVRRLSK